MNELIIMPIVFTFYVGIPLAFGIYMEKKTDTFGLAWALGLLMVMMFVTGIILQLTTT